MMLLLRVDRRRRVLALRAWAAVGVLAAGGGISCQRETGAGRDAPKASAAEGVAQGVEIGGAAGDARAAPSRAPGSRQPELVPPPADVAAPPADAIRTPSGLAYLVLQKPARQLSPGANDTALIHYTSWKTSGEMQYSTRFRNQPMPMRIHQLPPGWSETITDMHVGEKRRVWMSADLAFAPSLRLPKTGMTYEIELVDVHRAPPVPEDLDSPPRSARRTKNGIAYRVLRPGSETEHPRLWDAVMFHYTAWSRDGRILHTTTPPRSPTRMQPFRAPAGLRQALLTLVVGQKSRFWIPGALATQGLLRAPGDVVYDIELVAIERLEAPPEPPPSRQRASRRAKKLAGGVAYQVVTPGTGKKASLASVVKIHATLWDERGNLLMSSKIRNQPIQVALGQMHPPGLRAALEVMSEGETGWVWMPPERRGAAAAAPGERAAQPATAAIELLAVRESAQPPLAPADVAAPPAAAARTAKGVAYTVLAKGSGTRHPTPADTVVVHYTGWTTDGVRFDSSIPRREPAVFALGGALIEGWKEALPTMVEGETTRFWIPEELAYRGAPGKPKGMLVFDIELKAIR